MGDAFESLLTLMEMLNTEEHQPEPSLGLKTSRPQDMQLSSSLITGHRGRLMDSIDNFSSTFTLKIKPFLLGIQF